MIQLEGKGQALIVGINRVQGRSNPELGRGRKFFKICTFRDFISRVLIKDPFFVASPGRNLPSKMGQGCTKTQ